MSGSEELTKDLHNENQKILIWTSWIAILLASNLTIIIWREFAQGEPEWWPLVHLAGLLILLGLTLINASFKPLCKFICILLIIFILGFGGGWNWGLIPWIRSSSAWIEWNNHLNWAVSSVITHILRLAPCIMIILFLLIIGLTRKDFFLVKGNLHALVEPTKLLGVKKPEPWPRLAGIFAFVFTSMTFLFLIFAWEPISINFDQIFLILPIALIIATINSFNEEFALRAAPLSVLEPMVGKRHALLITSIYFGLGHFYGVPNGLIGVILAGFLGWFLGKSVLETRGFSYAWIIHFLPDVFIFTFYLLAEL